MKETELVRVVNCFLSENNISLKNSYNLVRKADFGSLIIIQDSFIQDESISDSSIVLVYSEDNLYHLVDGLLEKIIDYKFYILETLYHIHNKNNEIIRGFTAQVDSLEDSLFERSLPRHFMDIWFIQKKGVLKLERKYNRQIELIKDLQCILELESLVEDDKIIPTFEYALNQLKSLILKLDHVHHYYNSIKNDKLNSNIYYLTLLSGIFLPLNLIVGFFGMNTENLFFKDQASGTHYVVYILVGVFLLFTIGFRSLVAINRLLLRSNLGRYKFYQPIAKNIKKIESTFEM